MNIFTKTIGVACLIIATSVSHEAFAKNNTNAGSAPIYGTQNLVATINQAIYKVDPNLNIGVAVKSMKTGEVLYSRNETDPSYLRVS